MTRNLKCPSGETLLEKLVDPSPGVDITAPRKLVERGGKYTQLERELAEDCRHDRGKHPGETVTVPEGRISDELLRRKSTHEELRLLRTRDLATRGKL